MFKDSITMLFFRLRVVLKTFAFIKFTVSSGILGVAIASMALYGANLIKVKHIIEIIKSSGIACRILFNIYLATTLSLPLLINYKWGIINCYSPFD